MIKDIAYSTCQNKNFIMLISAGIYILSLFSVNSGYGLLISLALTIFIIFSVIKNYISPKLAFVWIIIFYLGIINFNIRLKQTDELLSIAPRNVTIYGKIVSIPQIKSGSKQSFYLNVNRVEYDSVVKTFKNEKLLVSLTDDNKFNVYDSYKFRGRLSVPFKSTNPSQFDYSNYLNNFSAYATFYGRNPYNWSGKNECYEKLDIKPTGFEKLLQNINNYRENVISIHSKHLKSPNLEILGGIVFGDDAVSPPENIRQSFINSGLLHILAASGMNVAFIFSFFFFLLNLFRFNYKLNISICMAAVITYVLMTGLGASVLRAGLMLIFVLLGKLVDRDAHSISLLSFVGMLMLIYNPMFINDVGFQLSFIVTFGLLVMSPYIIRSKNRILNWIIGTVSIPVIAQLWVIPIQIFYFNNISVYSVFANIMSVPILSLVSFGGFISSLLAGIKPIANIVCSIFDVILNPLISIIIKISDFWGNIPYSTFQTSHPSILQIIFYYEILLCIIGFIDKNIRNKFSNILKYLLISLIGLECILLIHIPNHNLEITAFNVGNADAFLIKTPENKYIMVDTGKSGYNGGKSQAEFIILKYFLDNNIKEVDSIIVTHFDNDHCGGVTDLIKNIKVNKIYVNSVNHTSHSAKEIYKSANDNNVTLIEANNNQIVTDNNDLKITNFIINDVPGIGDNESSIITLLNYGSGFKMLFTGDAGVSTIYKLLKELPRNITVLKVAHHGANGVINKEIVDFLNPQISLISTGENKFGHPSVYTTSLLKNTEILRTDINNAIKIKVNKQGYKIFTYNDKTRKFHS